VAIKLKGGAGSFQPVDAKPGLTLHFDKFKGASRFHGMKKFHLNNCAQDGTHLNEMIAGEMAHRAGVPASRCTHAIVKLNGREMGAYVVKEAFTDEMIARFYKDGDGDLYDGGFCKEVEENMEKSAGDPDDRRALRELIAACQEGDAAKRWERLGKILDIDRFMSFAAMEAIMCHWDGYNFNRNNYRLYQDQTTGKFSFFLHGMDQMFGDTNFPLVRDFGAMVGSAVMRCPEAPKLYRARLDSIYENVLKTVDWGARVTEAGEKLRLALEARNPQWAKDYAGRIGEERGRVEARIAAVG
jgi:spore coat protein CotH